MERFVRNSEILAAMEKASVRGQCVSSLDSVARILEVEVTSSLAFRSTYKGRTAYAVRPLF
jgi:hypothetical protein